MLCLSTFICLIRETFLKSSQSFIHFMKIDWNSGLLYSSNYANGFRLNLWIHVTLRSRLYFALWNKFTDQTSFCHSSNFILVHILYKFSKWTGCLELLSITLSIVVCIIFQTKTVFLLHFESSDRIGLFQTFHSVSTNLKTSKMT